MKGLLEFDPDEYAYGDATVALRRILKEWADVDWFVPGANEAGRARAMRLFGEHHAAAHSAKPDLFGPSVELRTRFGGWRDFHALYEQVSDEVRCRAGATTGPSWDWKFNGLKTMTREHSEARSFRLEAVAREISAEAPPQKGDLFFLWNGTVIWNSVFPKLELRERLPSFEANVAQWYVNYANQDLMEALEWQLAERSDDLATNPFVPLMRVYAEGFYPFSLSPNEVVLFAFSAN